MKRYTCILLFTLCGCVSVYSQPLSPRIENLVQEVHSLTYSNKFYSAQELVLQYLESNNLTDLETFYGHFLFADILKSSGKPGEAIKLLKDSKVFLKNVLRKTKYESLIEGNIAECHFNLMNYKEAKEYAQFSISTNPDSSLRAGGHAVNHLIIGYSDYLDKDYQHALEHYDYATSEYLDHGDVCELPLVYTKMAKTYNALGSKKLSEKYINKAVLISDSCDIEIYKLLSNRALFDICKKNKNYRKAIEVLQEINILVEKLDIEKQDQLISELKVKYETELMQNENENLLQINQKNEELLAKQKQALIITVIAIVILLMLTFMLIKISIKRKKAEQSLAILNVELEQKVAVRTAYLKEANNKIQENSALLASQNKQLIDFCNIVSHNLRSPLTNMSMLVDYIEKSKDEVEQKQVIEKLRPVINNLNETFDELVESLQIKQDLEIESEKILLEGSLQRILDGLKGEMNESQAVIETDFVDASEIHYPPKYLSSILHNLVSNALKYRSPDRKPIIKLKTKNNNGIIILSVKDNGLGIDLDKHKDDIFKIRKVFHEHPDAKGFGLYITKTQVETMGGKIWVESTPGEGSTFFVEFNDQNI